MSESEAEQPEDEEFEGEEEEEEEETAVAARARLMEHLSKNGVPILEGTEDFMYDIVAKQNAAEDKTAACHRQAREIADERAAMSSLYSIVHFLENILEPYIVQKYGKDWISRLTR